MVFDHTQIHQELLLTETDVEALLGMEFLQDHMQLPPKLTPKHSPSR